MQDALPLVPKDLADPVVHEMSVKDIHIFLDPIDESQHKSLGFWSTSLASSLKNYYFFWQISFDLLLGLSRD